MPDLQCLLSKRKNLSVDLTLGLKPKTIASDLTVAPKQKKSSNERPVTEVPLKQQRAIVWDQALMYYRYHNTGLMTRKLRNANVVRRTRVAQEVANASRPALDAALRVDVKHWTTKAAKTG